MTSKDLRHLFLKIASLFIVIGSSGCYVVKKVEYPVGIYSVGGSTNLQDVADAGFNLVTDPVPETFENRLAITDGSWVAERFEPFAVHVYGPLPLSKSP